jgi:hypothetical protein
MWTGWARVGARSVAAAAAVVAVLLGTAASAAALPGPPIGGRMEPNPWGCAASVASPHPTDGAITVHGTIECRDQAPSATSSVTLYSSRWYGWEQVDRQSRTSEFARYIDASPRWNPGMECHHYRGAGSFSVTGDGRTYDTSVLLNYDQRYLRGQSPGCGVNWR